MSEHARPHLKPVRSLALLLFILALCVSCTATAKNSPQAPKADGIPRDFVHVTDVIPDAILEIRYYSTYNFVGERVESYNAPVAILTKDAAQALKKAQQALDAQGYAIKIFDAYRPTSAVAHFVLWAEDVDDVKTKEYFYPKVDKKDLFRLGYIGEKSGHSRGSTVDLTIVEKKTGREVDMGSPFDFFGEISHPDSNLVSPKQKANRMILQKAMTDAGFLPLDEEWWHFRLDKEPYPNTYFDFPVQ